MQLPGGLGKLDFGNWIYGLLSGFISGGATAVTAGFIVSAQHPEHYAPGSYDFFQLVLLVFLMSGTMAAMAFLRTAPLPAMVKEASLTKTTDPQGAVTIVEKQKETTVTEQAKP